MSSKAAVAKSNFRWKNLPPPINYEREKRPRSFRLDDEMTLQQVLDCLGPGVSPSEAKISIEYDYDNVEVFVCYSTLESDDEYQDRITKETERLEKYEQWKLEYAEEIAEYLKKDADKKLLQSKRLLEKLNKELDKLAKTSKRKRENLEREIRILEESMGANHG